MMNPLRKRCAHLVILHCAALASHAASATVIIEEHVLLAGLLRELNTIDRLAVAPGVVSAQEAQRYHFDYTRLRADVQRISNGIQKYLSPQRAAPRDALALHGSYSDEAVAEQ